MLFPSEEVHSNKHIRKLKVKLEAEYVKKKQILDAVIRRYDELLADMPPQEFSQLLQLDAFLMRETMDSVEFDDCVGR